MNRGDSRAGPEGFSINNAPSEICINLELMFRAVNNEKIGNVLRFFAERLDYLPSMKAIKLLFFLDQAAIQEKGVPITWLEYKAWRFGPVPPSIWLEFRHGVVSTDSTFGSLSLEPYVHILRFENEESGNTEVNLTPNGAFDDSEFSASEIKLMERIVEHYGSMTGYQLSQLSHQEDSPWAKVVKLHQLDRRFAMGDSTPDVLIDLAAEIAGDSRFEAYLAAKEALETQTHIRHFAHKYGPANSPS
jgi:uncharacterized phage-associated protein